MRRSSRRRGTVVTEFALTLPIVLLFFFAAFEFCRFAMLNHTVENAVYEAARRGIVPGATADQVEDTAQEILSMMGIQTSTIDISPSNIQRETPEVTVSITVPFEHNTFAPANFFAGESIHRSLTLRRENVR